MKTGNNKNYPILRVGIWSKYDDLSRSSLICCHNTQCIKYFTISCNSSSSNSSVQSVIVSATWNMVLLSAQLFLISLLNFFIWKFLFSYKNATASETLDPGVEHHQCCSQLHHQQSRVEQWSRHQTHWYMEQSWYYQWWRHSGDWRCGDDLEPRAINYEVLQNCWEVVFI